MIKFILKVSGYLIMLIIVYLIPWIQGSTFAMLSVERYEGSSAMFWLAHFSLFIAWLCGLKSFTEAVIPENRKFGIGYQSLFITVRPRATNTVYEVKQDMMALAKQGFNVSLDWGDGVRWLLYANDPEHFILFKDGEYTDL